MIRSINPSKSRTPFYMAVRGSPFVFSSSAAWFVIVVPFLLATSNAKDLQCSTSCGIISDIRPPFRLKNDPKHCGLFKYELSCLNNVTVLYLNLSNSSPGRSMHVQVMYEVKAIEYNLKAITIRVAEQAGVKHDQNNNCSSFSGHSISSLSFNSFKDAAYDLSDYNTPIIFLECSNPVISSLYIRTVPCSDGGSSPYGYVKVGRTTASEVEDGCAVKWRSAISASFNFDKNVSHQDIHKALLYGFNLDFQLCFFLNKNGICVGDPSGPQFVHLLIPGFFAIKFTFGVPFLIVCIIYDWRRRHWSIYTATIIENFLQRNGGLVPIRYSYSNIKKMTDTFKDKLGEGGYGTVFKGKLRSGRFVAIKILSESKSNGQDFLSEMNTIGRIHHVNVVQLFGYCAQGSKRALVYDFMSNGSLDKYIYTKDGRSSSLSCKKRYEISLGVAQGIQYLHHGCDMHILHFDIKPHNILLEENFVPKISDFGLAKLCPVDNSNILLTAARGTMGYIAPELFYKNIGGISDKADVYSFGMLLMEMASLRKNINATVENSSQIYFPSWVYDRYNEGKELEFGDLTEEHEKELIKRMIITALWCIQMKPTDRPSMNKVIEMLEGDSEHLQMPPKPFLCPSETTTIVQDRSHPLCSVTELTSSLSAR